MWRSRSNVALMFLNYRRARTFICNALFNWNKKLSECFLSLVNNCVNTFQLEQKLAQQKGANFNYHATSSFHPICLIANEKHLAESIEQNMMHIHNKHHKLELLQALVFNQLKKIKTQTLRTTSQISRIHPYSINPHSIHFTHIGKYMYIKQYCEALHLEEAYLFKPSSHTIKQIISMITCQRKKYSRYYTVIY